MGVEVPVDLLPSKKTTFPSSNRALLAGELITAEGPARLRTMAPAEAGLNAPPPVGWLGKF